MSDDAPRVMIRDLVRGVLAARTRDDHSGSITPFVLIVTIALFMLGGLVIDGGRHLNAKSRAMAYAQEASRAGAQTIDLSRDRAVLVPDQAIAAASRFCERAMAEDSDLVECTPSTEQNTDSGGRPVVDVKVDTVIETDGILSGMFGVDTWTADAYAYARPVQGVTEADAGDLNLPPPETQTPTDAPFPTAGPSEPTDSTPSCPSPYYDPYNPENTWEPGEPRLDPPITDATPTEPVPCWEAWTPPKPKPDCDDPPPCDKPPESDDPPNCDDPPKCDDRGNGGDPPPEKPDRPAESRPPDGG